MTKRQKRISFRLEVQQPKLFLNIIRAGILVFLCFSAMGLKAQNVVKGTVSSGDSVLVGATVALKGSQSSTQTDEQGRFQINAPENGTLIISSVGYVTKNVAAKGSNISVRLESFASNLNDVVVVGYGTQRKSDVTGAVSSIKMKDIQKTPSPRLDDAIQGRTAGVEVQHNDASPNAAISIRVRGINSINGGNDPLVV